MPRARPSPDIFTLAMRCSVLWVATALLPLLLGFLGCRPAELELEKGPEPESRVIRLEELGDAVEAVVPDIGGEPVPKWLEDADLATLPRPGALKNVAMFLGEDGRESRAAFLAPPGTVYSFRLQVPSRALLRFALGYVVEPERIPQDLTYVITAEEDGVEPSVLFQEDVKTEQLGHWMDRQVSLAEWGGERSC